MTAFEVKINGKKKCTAGISEPGVVNAVLTWLQKKPEGRRRFKEKLELSAGGIAKADHVYLEWSNHKLRLGDEISIRIVEVATADKPKKRKIKRATPGTIRRRKQAHVKRMAKELGWTILTK